MKAIEELIALVEADTGTNGTCKDLPDDESVGWRGEAGSDKVLPMTFGHVRRARAELEHLKGNSQPIT